MPRYFFNVVDGFSEPDPDGVELPDLDAARTEAITAAGEILRDMGANVWDGTEWRMEVTDGRGRTLFVVRFSAEETHALLDSPDARG